MGVKSVLWVSFFWVLTALLPAIPGSGEPVQAPDAGNDPFKTAVLELYTLLQEPSLKSEAFLHAMLGYHSLCAKGLVARDSILSVIDYSIPSSEERLFVIHLRSGRILYKSLVAHGRNSGELYASRFSNRIHSHQTALGFYITGETYTGGQGYSMHLTGVDTGYNDHAQVRSIVIHGAAYATPQYVKQYGRLGRSFGCPALPPNMNADIIQAIKDGSVLFAYYPDRDYLQDSPVLGAISRNDDSNKPVF
jgi:hypothetical protein